MKHSLTVSRQQRGISLFVVLIALIIISFAAVTLLRSTGTGTLVSGNLAFQKTALASGDAGSEQAIAWLVANAASGALFQDDAANGYYATTADNCDLTGTRTAGATADDVNWTGSDPGGDCNMDARTATVAGIANGYTVRYVVNRVCNSTGDPNAVLASDGLSPMVCSRVDAGASDGSTRSGGSYGNLPLTGESQTYYRITTRIDGPRNTVRYLQAYVVI